MGTTASLGDVVLNLRANDVNMKAGLEQINDTLQSSVGKVRSFKGILELAFGLNIGRQFLQQVHEGLMKFAGGVYEGIKAGEAWQDVIGDGIKRVLGMETALEAHNKRMAEYKTVVDAGTKAQEQFDKALAASQGDIGDHPNVPGADAGLDALHKAAHDAVMAQGKGNQTIADKQARIQSDENSNVGMTNPGLLQEERRELAALIKDQKRLDDAAAGALAAWENSTKAADEAEQNARDLAYGMDLMAREQKEQVEFIEGNRAYEDALRKEANADFEAANKALEEIEAREQKAREDAVKAVEAFTNKFQDTVQSVRDSGRDNAERSAVSDKYRAQEKALQDKTKSGQSARQMGFEEYLRSIQESKPDESAQLEALKKLEDAELKQLGESQALRKAFEEWLKAQRNSNSLTAAYG